MKEGTLLQPRILWEKVRPQEHSCQREHTLDQQIYVIQEQTNKIHS